MNVARLHLQLIGLLVLIAGLCGNVPGAQMSAPSALHTNLGPVPIDDYDYAHTLPLQGYPNLGSSCPGKTTVRDCYRAVLAGFTAQQQHVTGVRFFFDLCGGANSTPLVNCASGNYRTVSGPTAPWTTNLQNFFNDIISYGIHSVTPTMGHSDGVGPYGGLGQVPVWYTSPAPSPSGGRVAGAPSIVQYVPGLPYGEFPCTNTPPYYCPSDQKVCGGTNGYCYTHGGYKNPGYPIDDGDTGYNNSPTNPYFVGWQNTYNVWGFVLQAAHNAGLTIEELDVEQELNTLQFPVQARLIVDNSRADTGNPDNLNAIRYYMNLYPGNDQKRVTWSSIAPTPTVAGAVDCGSGHPNTDVYQDYARNINLDSLISAIQGSAWIGWPWGPYVANGLICGGSTSNNGIPYMYLTTWGPHSPLPNIVDEHIYPCIRNPNTGICYNTEPQASVQTEMFTFFSEIPHYLTAVGQQGAVFMLGETHTSSNDGLNETCDIHAPLTAASSIVAAYNQSGNGLAGNDTFVVRPFINLNDTCFTPTNQLLNQNNAGPYTPSIQQ